MNTVTKTVKLPLVTVDGRDFSTYFRKRRSRARLLP